MKRVAIIVIAVLFKISKLRTFQFFGEIVPSAETNARGSVPSLTDFASGDTRS